MKPAVLVTPLTKEIPNIKDADYIGVDAGCLRILNQRLPLAFGVGDFDSMDKDMLEVLKQRASLTIHPVQKDETDSELALRLCHKKGYSPLILTGSLHGRIDHTIANIRLLMYRYADLILWEPDQKMYCLLKGIHTIRSSYKHISFFAIEDSIVSLEGFLYPLHQYDLKPDDIITVSNSIVKEQGIIALDKGKVLCIESNVR
ncbi:thiamine diphosphokinase [Faecalicoccus pleomorphus]|uniref:thiamine diphosphokinase n=1 Tax=Faecalicoccus pleomorphus TaxID=1323 RepID=UPI003DA5DB04